MIKSMQDAKEFLKEIFSSEKKFWSGIIDGSRTHYGHDGEYGYYTYSVGDDWADTERAFLDFRRFVRVVWKHRKEINKGSWELPTYRVGTEIYLMTYKDLKNIVVDMGYDILKDKFSFPSERSEREIKFELQGILGVITTPKSGTDFPSIRHDLIVNMIHKFEGWYPQMKKK